MARVLSDQNELVPTAQFPHARFPFEKFNPVQSRAFELVDSRENVLVASATASGKTITSELFMSHEIRVKKKKALYLSPLRSLAIEKNRDWRDKNYHFNDLKVCICTGDYRLTPQRKLEVEEADILIFTSETLNSRSRNYKSENNQFLKDIGVVVADEFHLCGVDIRGSHAESGMIKFTEINPDARFIMLSATLPNVEEVADWVTKLTGRETSVIRSNYRPCPLEIHFPTYRSSNNYDDNENVKCERAMDIIDKHSSDKFLVFVHSKRTGDQMLKRLRTRNIKSDFHNADLELSKREGVESSFRDGDTRVLVATSTLAWGCFSIDSWLTLGNGKRVQAKDIKEGYHLQSLNESWNIKSAPVMKVEIKSGNGVEVSLADGSYAKVTEDHLFMATIEGELPKWTQANQLTANHFVAISNDSINDKSKVVTGEYLASKLLQLPIQSETDKICTYDLKWTRVNKIVSTGKGKFVELQVDSSTHAYFGQGMLSHNCNLPSRRVIVLGVHRGRDEVETFDIHQECGRAGRPKYDPAGDAYVLLPDMQALKHKERILTPAPIKSKMIGVNTLAFHIVSEIHHRACKTLTEIENWYKKTLAFHQRGFAGLGELHDAVSKLEQNRCIKIDGEQIETTGIGTASSMFYFCPFDTSALHKNMKKLFSAQKHSPEKTAFALACIPSFWSAVPTAAEVDELDKFKGNQNIVDAHQFFAGNQTSAGETRAAYCYYNLLINRFPSSPSLASSTRGFKYDFDRLGELLMTLDDIAGKWNKHDFFKNMKSQVVYGVPFQLVDLVRLDGIGAVKAKKLYDAGFKTLDDIVNKPLAVASTLRCKPEAAKAMAENAKLLLMGSNR